MVQEQIRETTKQFTGRGLYTLKVVDVIREVSDESIPMSSNDVLRTLLHKEVILELECVGRDMARVKIVTTEPIECEVL